MELNTTFAMFNAKELTYNDRCMGKFYAHKLAVYRKDIGYCNPLRNAHALKLSVCSLARTGGNSLSYFNLISFVKMPKNNEIKASAKYSNTPFTSSHETASSRISINPTLSKMLSLASAIRTLAELYFSTSKDDVRDLMFDVETLSSDIIVKLGDVAGKEIAEQAFNFN